MRMVNFQQVEKRYDIESDEFFRNFVGKKPIVMSRKVKTWGAVSKWSEDYFLECARGLFIDIKVGDTSEKKTVKISLEDYIKHVAGTKVIDSSLYLHDVSLPTLIPSLKDDMSTEAPSFIPKWYQYK